ncbi:TIGR02302 family protein [Roseovarius aquimarinus]|uniref:TIGR02302 family protein n=1 Tax=Roseovarius aquimarinus TaxID=1229156 RepID=A0ABW7I9X7_9RHOB
MAQTPNQHAPDSHEAVRQRLRGPLSLTWAGLLAERLVRAFWPLWTLMIGCGAALMLGWQDLFSFEVTAAAAIAACLGALALLVVGVSGFRWPRRAEALARLDAGLPGRPLQALGDAQAIGRGDAASEALWQTHLERMQKAAASARAPRPDLRIARLDRFGLRYIALLGLVVAVMFGSVLRIGAPAQMLPGGAAGLATGPAWEGWIEPPVYTGLPTLYLADQGERIEVPEGSRVMVRLYGELGALALSETVSGRTDDLGAATDPAQGFDVTQDGTLAIDGPGGRTWDIRAVPDTAPSAEVLAEGAKTTFDGQMSQPYAARDDHGVIGGTARFALDLGAVDRRHGLAAEPEPREPITLDLPLPITGSRTEFTEALVENLSEHPWAHMPMTLTIEVEDAAGQTGASAPMPMDLPARRFFDPVAAALIEQRRDLLWSRDNATRVAQVIRAVSYKPEEKLFRDPADFLKLRTILRRLEASLEGGLDAETRDELAAALWDLAVTMEDGDIGDALERMREAQERLSEAMRNGASEDEVARLMQELRDATDDYLRQKSQQAQREDETDQRDMGDREMTMLSQQDLQDMMDRIQELMQEGRMAEAEEALRQFQEMMENLRVTEGQPGQGEGSPGQQAMEGLADTLRQQQGLSDQAFRDLQEQFNPGARAGESQGNEGRNGGQGRGQSHEGQGGQGEAQGGEGEGNPQGEGQQRQSGQGGGQPGDLAARQEALRQELERQRGSLPGSGAATEEARGALDRAGEAMDGAEEALRGDDLAEAIDRQAEAMDALRDGMRSLGEAMAEQQGERQGGQGQAQGATGGQQSDPLGRTPGQGDRAGTDGNLLQGEDVYRRARELLEELRRRSGEGARPEVERDYLERLLERF